MLKLQFCHLDLVIMCEQDLNKSNKKYNRYNRINNTGIYWADPQKMYVVKERKKRKEKKNQQVLSIPPSLLLDLGKLLAGFATRSGPTAQLQPPPPGLSVTVHHGQYGESRRQAGGHTNGGQNSLLGLMVGAATTIGSAAATVTALKGGKWYGYKRLAGKGRRLGAGSYSSSATAGAAAVAGTTTVALCPDKKLVQPASLTITVQRVLAEIHGFQGGPSQQVAWHSPPAHVGQVDRSQAGQTGQGQYTSSGS